MAKDTSIPIRFDPEDEPLVEKIKEETELKGPDILRRSLRLFYKACLREGFREVAFKNRQFINLDGLAVDAAKTKGGAEKPAAHKIGTKKKVGRRKLGQLMDIRCVSLSIVSSIPAGWPEHRRAMKATRTVDVPRGKYPGNAFGLDVTGESMNAAKGRLGPILPGDTVILVPFESCDGAAGKIVAARIDGRTTLKRFVCPKGADCYLRPESDRPEFVGAMHPLDELEIQGVVIGKL